MFSWWKNYWRCRENYSWLRTNRQSYPIKNFKDVEFCPSFLFNYFLIIKTKTWNLFIAFTHRKWFIVPFIIHIRRFSTRKHERYTAKLSTDKNLNHFLRTFFHDCTWCLARRAVYTNFEKIIRFSHC